MQLNGDKRDTPTSNNCLSEAVTSEKYNLHLEARTIQTLKYELW